MESNNEIDPHRDQQADSQSAVQEETTQTLDTPDISENAHALIVENSGETTVGANPEISHATTEPSEINGTNVKCIDGLNNMDNEHNDKSTSLKETNEGKENMKTGSIEHPTDVVKSVSVMSDDSKNSMSSVTTNLLRFSLSKQEKVTTDKKTTDEETPDDEKKVQDKKSDEQKDDEKKAKETDKTSGKKTDVSNVGEPNRKGKDAPSSSTFLKLDRKFSLHDDSTGPPASSLRASSSGAFYLEVRGMLEIVNMDDLRTQLSNEVGEGTKRVRPSVSPKTSPADVSKSRSTSVPAKAVSKRVTSKDSSNKRLVKKPEVLNKTYGSSRTSISAKKVQAPPLPSAVRQLPKKSQESNIQAKEKENGPGTVATRFLGSQKTITNEEKNVPAVKEKMKATFIPTKKESLKDLPTKPSTLTKERLVGKVLPQSLMKSLPPKDLLSKIKSPLPVKAMPKQVRPLQKTPSEQKEKEAGDTNDSQKETTRRASLTNSGRNNSKPNAGIAARKSSVRVKTNAAEAVTKKENPKQISSLRSDPKRVLSNSAKISLAKLAGNVKSKEKKKSHEKEKELPEKKMNSSDSSFKKLETKEKVPDELSKEETQVEKVDTQENKDTEETKEEEKNEEEINEEEKKEEEKKEEEKKEEEKKEEEKKEEEKKEEEKTEEEKEPKQKQEDENEVLSDEVKKEDESKKMTNEQQETHPEEREITDGPKEDPKTEKPEEQSPPEVNGNEEVKPEEETEVKLEKTLKEDDTKTETNEEEAVVETEKKAEQVEGNEIKSEQKIEEKQVTPEEEVKEVEVKEAEVKEAEVKEAEVKIPGKIDTSRTTDRKKTERKKSDGKKSVDLKSIKKANMKPEIALMKKPESKLKMGLKLKGLHKNGNITVPPIKSDVTGILKEKKETKKIVTKDMEKASMFTSLTLKKGLHTKKSNDLKKTGVLKSETKDTNTEKKKLDIATEKTSVKVSIKGSMKVAVKGIAKGALKTPVKAATKGPITAASKTTAAKTPTSAKASSSKTASTITAKTQSVASVKESEKTPEIDKTAETEKINEAETTDVVKEETTEAEKTHEGGETLEKEKNMDTGIAPETETDSKVEPVAEPSQEIQIEEMQGKEAEKNEQDATASLRSLESSKVTLRSLTSLNSKGKSVKPLNLKRLGSSKNKKSGIKKNITDLVKLEDQTESNAQTTSGNREKGNAAGMGTEKETENKSKESNVSPPSKRSLKIKKSLSSKIMSGSVTNNSLSKKISSISDTKSKNSTIRKKMGSGLKGTFGKVKNATTSKGDKPLKKQKSKALRRNTENFERIESMGKNVLRRSQTKKDFTKSGIGLGSLSSSIKTDMKLRKFKTEEFNTKLMRKYMKPKGKKKSKKENTATTDSDDDFSTKMTGPAMSGADSPNILAHSLTEKMSLGTSKIGSSKAHSSTAKKSKLKKQKSEKLAQLTSTNPNSVSADVTSLASPMHAASTKSKKKKNKKNKSVNLWNDTLEEEMDRIIQDNTILLDEQTDQKMRQMLLENEKKLMDCKNAVADADNSQKVTSPIRITPSKLRSRAKSVKAIPEQTNMHHLTAGGPLYDCRSASVGTVMRNASTTLNKKPFMNVFNSNAERYNYEPPIRPSIKVVPGKLQEPSSKTAKWLFNNCCYQNTVQNDINIIKGRNEPMLKDFSSLLNEQNKYIPVVYGSQQAFNPNVNTLNDSLNKSNIYNSNMITKKMQYYSNNVPNTNPAEVTLPINYRNTHHSFSVKIKKFPDIVPTRSSFCNCV